MPGRARSRPGEETAIDSSRLDEMLAPAHVAGIAYDPERKSVLALLENGRVFRLNEWVDSDFRWREEAPVPGTTAREYLDEIREVEGGGSPG